MAELKVELLDEAKADFRQAVAWYRQNATLKVSRQFALSFSAAMQQIAIYPKSGSVFRESIRRIYLGEFPYWAYYREIDDRIEVVAVFHARRDSYPE